MSAATAHTHMMGKPEIRLQIGYGVQTTRVPSCLKTDRLIIRCPRPSDGPALRAAILDSLDNLRPWFNWTAGLPITLEQSVASARFAQWRFWAGRELTFFLFLQGTKQLIGVCGLCDPNWSRPQFELRYWLRTDYEGKGYMTEAATAVVDLAFNRLGAKLVEIRCKPANKSSVALAQRLGFVRDDHLPAQEDASGESVFARVAAD